MLVKDQKNANVPHSRAFLQCSILNLSQIVRYPKPRVTQEFSHIDHGVRKHRVENMCTIWNQLIRHGRRRGWGSSCRICGTATRLSTCGGFEACLLAARKDIGATAAREPSISDQWSVREHLSVAIQLLRWECLFRFRPINIPALDISPVSPACSNIWPFQQLSFACPSTDHDLLTRDIFWDNLCDELLQSRSL